MSFSDPSGYRRVSVDEGDAAGYIPKAVSVPSSPQKSITIDSKKDTFINGSSREVVTVTLPDKYEALKFTDVFFK